MFLYLEISSTRLYDSTYSTDSTFSSAGNTSDNEDEQSFVVPLVASLGVLLLLSIVVILFLVIFFNRQKKEKHVSLEGKNEESTKIFQFLRTMPYEMKRTLRQIVSSHNNT